MADVGEPTPMKREQDTVPEREAEIRRNWTTGPWLTSPLGEAIEADVKWLLSELARLRTEAHQMQEALETVDDYLGDHTATNHETQAEADRCDLCAALAAVRSVLRATEANNGRE